MKIITLGGVRRKYMILRLAQTYINIVPGFSYSSILMDQLTYAVKREARGVGFDLVGITTPLPSAHIVRYREWLEEGYHAGMGYLARPDAVERRSDPRRVMPGVRSIVVVGMNYYPGDFPPVRLHHGRVSRYAWGRDYHDVMLDMLQRLASRIKGLVGRPTAHRAYVDFGPLMERELAYRAGLGWIGKNTNLIHPTLGSYIFLGELLLDVELKADVAGLGDRCGRCTACLEACPTGALRAPRVLDARRCISYLTIEHRGIIPEALRPSIGDWVFGCDICQEVCPWNKRFARPAASSALGETHPSLDLLELLAMSEDAFRTRFRDTPLWRSGYTGLLRNAAVTLGNLGSGRALGALEQACRQGNQVVVEQCGVGTGAGRRRLTTPDDNL